MVCNQYRLSSVLIACTITSSMQKTIHIVAYILLLSLSAMAQYNIPENNTWVLGLNTGVNFNTGVAVRVPTTMNGALEVPANASVCDQNGQFLFYTDGSRIWDRTGNVMPNANPLHPYSMANYAIGRAFVTEQADQGATIVPIPGNPNQYYVFSLTSTTWRSVFPSNATGLDAGTLLYSVVDMTLHGGLGDVVPGKKWVYMDSTLTLKAIAVRGNHCNVWLLVHDRDSAIFKAYEITRNGISTNPVLSHVGKSDTIIHRPPGYNFWDTTFNWRWLHGPMVISPNRKKLAAAYSEGAMIEIYDFDPNTGIVANAMLLHDALPKLEYPKGVCFSSDNSKLYANVSVCTPNMPGHLLPSYLYQYDLSMQTQASIINSRTTLTVGLFTATTLKLAPNNKIYYRYLQNPIIPSPTTKFYISLIDSPNLKGLACKNINKVDSIMTPAPSWSGWVLPNEVAKASVGGDTVYQRTDTALCSGQGNIFLTPPSGYDTYQWNDGSTAAKYSVTAGGIYWSIARDQCHTRIDTFVVRKTDTTTSRIDTKICLQESTSLIASAGYSAYLWQDGSSDRTYTIHSPGIYWVSSMNYCTNHIDTFVVTGIDPSFSLGNDTTICDGSSLTLTVSIPDAGYLWQDGSTDNSYTITHSGLYALTVTVKDCKETHDINVTIRNVQQQLGNDTSICNDVPITLSLYANAENGDVITWSDNSHEASLLVKDTGIYWVTVTGNCFGQDTIHIGKEICNCRLEMPTAFTPNADGRNDIFRPWIQPACPIDNFILYIYNRWGQLLYQTADVSKGWDGLYNGKPCEIGTYMYRVVFTGGTQKNEQLFMGDLTLIR